MKKINACGVMVIVKVLKEIENVSAGGIFIPTTVTSEPQVYGKVISAGPEVTYVKADDVIIFHQRAGQVILMDNEEYRVLKQEEIYGSVE
jgi:co-chaperonin GroES (HSP10)